MVLLCNRHPGTRRTGHTEEHLGTDSSSMRGSAPLADLAVAWHGVDCDVARAQNIPYHYHLV